MEPIADASEDEYEPPPHVFAQLGRGLLKLYRFVFRQPLAPMRWRYVWQSLFLALTFVCLSGPLFRHLPSRFHADGWWQFQMNLRLMRDLRSSHAQFWRDFAWYSAIVAVIGPVREELLYRGLPILMARFAERKLPEKATRTAVMLLAASSSLYFAWRHNPIFWALPLPQLTFGAMAWWVAWKRGLRYSVLLHMGVNLLLMAVVAERIWLFTSHH